MCRAPRRATRPGSPRSAAPVRHYIVLRDALGGDDGLDERQRRYLRWLADWDDETASVVASLFLKARRERRAT